MKSVLEVLGSDTENMSDSAPGTPQDSSSNGAAAEAFAPGNPQDISSSGAPAEVSAPETSQLDIPAGQPAPVCTEAFINECMEELKQGRLKEEGSEETYMAHVENYLQKKFMGIATQKHADSGADSNIPEEEAQFKQALKLEGKFDMKGSVGIKWANAKNTSLCFGKGLQCCRPQLCGPEELSGGVGGQDLHKHERDQDQKAELWAERLDPGAI